MKQKEEESNASREAFNIPKTYHLSYQELKKKPLIDYCKQK